MPEQRRLFGIFGASLCVSMKILGSWGVFVRLSRIFVGSSLNHPLGLVIILSFAFRTIFLSAFWVLPFSCTRQKFHYTQKYFGKNKLVPTQAKICTWMQFIPTIEKKLALIIFLIGTNKNSILESISFY